MSNIVNLEKGGRVDLQKSVPALKRLRIGLGWKENKTDTGSEFDLDVTAFVLKKTASGDLVCKGQEHMAFYNTPASGVENGTILHSGDNRVGGSAGDNETLTIDVERLKALADELSIVITIHKADERKQNFGQVSNSYAKIYDDETGAIIAQYDLEEGFSVETAVQIGSLYKNSDGNMAFKAIGAGSKVGLDYFVKLYGMAVA